jgi:probable rRNA maturation factor
MKVKMLDVDCDIVAGDWDEALDWDALAERAISAALAAAGFAELVGDAPGVVEVAVRLTDDAEVQRLNRDYRGKDKPTNILSFPMHDPGRVEGVLAEADVDVLLGDLALAAETIAAEAEEKGIPIGQHVAHLLVHGTLHLLGHDHEDDASAERMEALETRILAGLGIADPYRDGDSAGHRPARMDEGR